MPSAEEIYLQRRYWHRSILIPLWTQQFLLQTVGVVGFWAAITIYWSGGPAHGAPGKKGSHREQAILGTFFILYLTLTLATLGEILLYSVNALKPKGYLLSQILKTGLSIGVWGMLVLWPYVIKDPIVSRFQATVGLEAVFAWLQIPMLSSLVHAVLVWREEVRVRRELREHGHESISTIANHADLPRQSSFGYGSFTPRMSERAPLLSHTSNSRILGGGRQRSEIAT